jgi:hypothetical protein
MEKDKKSCLNITRLLKILIIIFEAVIKILDRLGII